MVGLVFGGVCIVGLVFCVVCVCGGCVVRLVFCGVCVCSGRIVVGVLVYASIAGMQLVWMKDMFAVVAMFVGSDPVRVVTCWSASPPILDDPLCILGLFLHSLFSLYALRSSSLFTLYSLRSLLTPMGVSPSSPRARLPPPYFIYY